MAGACGGLLTEASLLTRSSSADKAAELAPLPRPLCSLHGRLGLPQENGLHK